MSSSFLCEVKGVEKTYPMGDLTVTALKNVSVGVSRGEFTVFSGPSGSGKSTLLNLIGCLDRPSKGDVFLEGKNIAQLSDGELGMLRANRIGFIFQSFNLIPVLTAYENIELALKLANQEKDIASRVNKALEDVGLLDYRNRRPSQLSGGQQQRVAIARALVKSPALVIADEPTANLDSKNGAAILELMKQMNQRDGVTFLFSTHDQLVMEHARRVVRLRDGELVGDDDLSGRGR